MSAIYPSLPVVLFQLAAVIARGELPDPTEVNVQVGEQGEISVELRFADPDHLRRWMNRCGNDAARFIHDTPWDRDGTPHVITSTHGHFAGAYIRLVSVTPADNPTDPSGGTS